MNLFLNLNQAALGVPGVQPWSAGQLVFFIVNQIIFAPLWGIAVGLATFTMIRFMRVLDAHTIFALSIASPYLA